MQEFDFLPNAPYKCVLRHGTGDMVALPKRTEGRAGRKKYWQTKKNHQG